MEVSEHLTWEKFWSVVEGKEQLYLGSNTRMSWSKSVNNC